MRHERAFPRPAAMYKYADWATGRHCNRRLREDCRRGEGPDSRRVFPPLYVGVGWSLIKTLAAGSARLHRWQVMIRLSLMPMPWCALFPQRSRAGAHSSLSRSADSSPGNGTRHNRFAVQLGTVGYLEGSCPIRQHGGRQGQQPCVRAERMPGHERSSRVGGGRDIRAGFTPGRIGPAAPAPHTCGHTGRPLAGTGRPPRR